MSEENTNHQKIKLLKLMEIINSETDPDHPLSTEELCNRLIAMHITCNKKTLGRDMKLLRAQGYEIKYYIRNHERLYYVEDRTFSIGELRIIIDALQAAGFIPESKTEELVEKVANLASSHKKELLKNNIVRFNTRKHSNEAVFENVNTLEEAVRKKRMASFCYFDLNEKKERVYRKNGERYEVEPLALIYHEDFYYLVTYNNKYENLVTYRIDRMTDVQMEPIGIGPMALEKRKTLRFDRYTKSAFKMFNGPEETVCLQFPDKLLGPVLDKFGEETKVKRIKQPDPETGEPGLLEVKVTIQQSPVFQGWISQFGGEMIEKKKY